MYVLSIEARYGQPRIVEEWADAWTRLRRCLLVDLALGFSRPLFRSLEIFLLHRLRS